MLYAHPSVKVRSHTEHMVYADLPIGSQAIVSISGGEWPDGLKSGFRRMTLVARTKVENLRPYSYGQTYKISFQDGDAFVSSTATVGSGLFSRAFGPGLDKASVELLPGDCSLSDERLFEMLKKVARGMANMHSLYAILIQEDASGRVARFIGAPQKRERFSEEAGDYVTVDEPDEIEWRVGTHARADGLVETQTYRLTDTTPGKPGDLILTWGFTIIRKGETYLVDIRSHSYELRKRFTILENAAHEIAAIMTWLPGCGIQRALVEVEHQMSRADARLEPDEALVLVMATHSTFQHRAVAIIHATGIVMYDSREDIDIYLETSGPPPGLWLLSNINVSYTTSYDGETDYDADFAYRPATREDLTRLGVTVNEITDYAIEDETVTYASEEPEAVLDQLMAATASAAAAEKTGKIGDQTPHRL